MAKKNFYVVVKGVVPGIYKTWAECQKNTSGYPGAIFKGFETKEEADAFFENGRMYEDQKTVKKQGITGEAGCQLRLEQEAEAIAYVDGSYEHSRKEYAYGVVMFYEGKEEHFAAKAAEPDMVSMRNVAGEIEGAKKAMLYCMEKGIKTLDIYYDYEGVEKWCTGVWKANKVGTKRYKEFYDEAKKCVNVRFVKVKGHSGDKYNDLADALAKGALGIEV